MSSTPCYMLPSLLFHPIKLTTQGTTTEWRPIRKIQEDAFEMTGNQAISYTEPPVTMILLRCESTDGPHREAMIIVYMQIPVLDADILPQDHLARNPVKTISASAVELENAYKRLRDGNCKHAPSFLGTCYVEQDSNGWVPGEYIFYLGVSVVPGIQFGTGRIGEGPYFDSDSEKRAEMRNGFKEAYSSIAACDVGPWGLAGARDLFWDESTRKVSVHSTILFCYRI
ncbi:hypothetical protein BO71DRAFT_386060 [Aspergillus ellipticus CBS 707.79]|uniref:Uncharacterized protein n=1 Tax=Aspergillus ellipticus CBS 707.79 TaxID=1448320 RepID=A0A319D0Y1_9EURO|nr:hypothetical protein BO71DRAFT_386060 [Aspergillus ellipticus CBS 707.79]